MSIHADVAQDILIHCDRTKSKEARFALKRLVWDPLRKSGIRLSSTCLLALENDILHAQESRKLQVTGSLCKCSICRKVFKTEHFLDKHFARKHANVKFETGRICFADMCGSVIPCVPFSRTPLPPVSSAILSQELATGVDYDSGVFVRPKFCNDDMLRRRRISACVEVVKQCLLHAEGGSEISLRNHVHRMQSELCERSVEVACVAREDVWSTFGAPHEALGHKPKMSTAGIVSCTMFTLLIFIVTIYIVMGGRWSKEYVRRLKHRKIL